MITREEAIEIAENKTGYDVSACELQNNYYFCKVVPKGWDGSDKSIPIDSVCYTVNKNTGEFKVFDMTELASVLQGGETN